MATPTPPPTDPLQKFIDTLAELGKTLRFLQPQIGNSITGFENLGRELNKIVTAFEHTMHDVVQEINSALADALADNIVPAFEHTMHDVVQEINSALAGIKAPAAGSGAAPAAGAGAAEAAGGMEAFGEAVLALGAVLGEVVAAAVGAVAAVAAVAAAIIGLGEVMAFFVSKANPALVEVFTNAVDDLMAVIGQALSPAFQVVTQLVRMMADSLHSWLPELGAVIGVIFQALVPAFRVVSDAMGRVGQVILQVADAAQPAIEGLMGAVSQVMEALEPAITEVVELIGGIMVSVIQELTIVINQCVPFITAFVLVLVDFVKWLIDAARQVLAFIGIEVADADTHAPKPGESVGAAAKGTSIGDIDSVIKKAQQSAFSLGTGASDPPTRTASAAEALKKRADEIYQLIKDFPEELGRAIARFFKENLPGGAKTAEAIDKLSSGDVGGAAEAAADASGATTTVSRAAAWGARQWDRLPDVW